ncbi:MAG: FHA domain protein [Firmicutes bacterium ADurb.Bin419]|nr:MAG: FHA domain protein [Firmicutes bacterium ADurb.Bin419]
MQPPKPAIEKQVKQEQKPPMPKSNMGFEVPGMQGKVFADEQKADNAKKKDKKGGFFSSIFGGDKKNEEKNDGDVNTNPSPKNPPPQNPIFNNQNSRVEITPVKISENQEKPQGIHQVLIPLEESEYERTTILNPQAPISPDNAAIVKNQNVLPYLVRKKTDEKIVINKAFFKMGKEPDYVDYLCDNNPAVSRSHADIITRNNEYFIRDNNSTNGTFVNKVRIVGNQEVKIKHEDVITLADEVFEFRIY